MSTKPDSSQIKHETGTVKAVLDIVRGLPSYEQSVKNTAGVSGNAGDDQGAAINAAIVAAATKGKCDLYLPDGVYDTSIPIVQLPGVTLKLAKGASIRAVSAMPALLKTPEDQPLFGVGVYGGVINCNDLASIGLDANWFQNYNVEDFQIENFITHGARFGLAGTPYSSYEALIHKLRTFRGAGTVAAGSMAVHMRAATDARVSDSILQGAQTGLVTNAGGTYVNCHAWVRSTTGALQYGFDDQAGSAKFIGCYGDTPHIAGFRIPSGNTSLIGCGAFMNELGGVDNTADGVLITSTAPNATVTGFTAIGMSPGFRFRKDINIDAVTNPAFLQLVGNTANNCVTVAPTVIIGKEPLVLDGAAGAQIGMRLKLAGQRRWDVKTDSSGNLVFQRFDASGVFVDAPISINLQFGTINMNANSVGFAGTWEKPITLGSSRLWVEVATGKLRIKASAPTFDSDGTVVGTQT